MHFTRWGMLILLPIALVLTGLTEPAVAQTGLRIEQLQVDLWPEYDRADMLVIYRGTLPADAPLPATLTLRLPSRVGEPHAVAYSDGSGNLLQADYSTTTTDDWLAVTLETPTSNFQLEFYDSLARLDEQRSYTFVWPGDYAVDEISIGFMPPPDASEIRTEPTLSPFQTGADSLSYGGTLGSLAAGQESRLTVSYRGGTVGVAVAAPSPTSEESNKTPLVIGAAVALLSLIIGGGMWLWYTRRPKPQPAEASLTQRRGVKGKRRTPRKAAAQVQPPPPAYCTHCGNPLKVGDRFCGQCGKPVKGKTRTRG
jgi:hypothetical protein